MFQPDDVTIRFSRPQDTAAVAALSQLDSARCPRGRLLLAEVAGELHAALPVDGGRAVADPFRHTAGLVRLLELRRESFASPAGRRFRRLAPVLRLRSAKARRFA